MVWQGNNGVCIYTSLCATYDIVHIYRQWFKSVNGLKRNLIKYTLRDSNYCCVVYKNTWLFWDRFHVIRDVITDEGEGVRIWE